MNFKLSIFIRNTILSLLLVLSLIQCSNNDNSSNDNFLDKNAERKVMQPKLAKADFTNMSAMTKIPSQPLTGTLAAKSGIRTITTDWLVNLSSDFEYSTIYWLNDSNLIYSYQPVKSTQEWNIELINTVKRKRKLLGKGTTPKPSPDGQWIAFAKGTGKEKQLWVMKANGNGARQLSHVKNGLGNSYFYDFAWSPDSKTVALKHQPNVPIFKKSPIKSKIDLIDVVSGESKQIASIEATIYNLSWLPNGKELLFMKIRVGMVYNSFADYSWIESINIDTGEIKTILQFDGLQQLLQPTSSPNGESIAFMYDADNPIFNFMPSIGLLSTSSNTKPIPIKRLTYEVKLINPQWSYDGKFIYVLRDYGAYKQIYAVNVKTGLLKQITNAPLNIENFAISPNGLQLAWIGQDAQATRVIKIASSIGEKVQEIITIPAVPKDMALSEVREIEWETTDYPTKMRGLLFLPLNYKSGHHYPLIVDIHGGDVGAHIYMTGGLLVSTPLEWHMWTAKGYAVFVPEFRSSASFGSLAITRDYLQNHDRLGGDLKDIEAGVNKLIADGIADKDRLAIIGHSAGSVRANWFAVKTHRYKAIISKEGWADEYIMTLNMPPSKRLYSLAGGAPQDVPQNYLKNSALFNSAGATIPILFFMGDPKFGGVDNSDIKIFYTILKAQKVETKYIKYSGEDHVFTKPANRKDVLERSIEWIDKHMKAEE